MLNKIIVFCIFLLLLVIGYIFIQYYSNNVSKISIPFTSHISPQPSPVTKASLTLQPNPLTILPGAQGSINVVIHTEQTSPSLIQFEIAYDPIVLTNMTVTQGDFFTNPTILLQTINNNSGRISYALEKASDQTVIKAEGIVATLHFQTNPFLQRETTISFLPKTVIRVEDQKNILYEATNANILIQASSSAIPNQIIR